MADDNIWKRVLVTGGSGYLGQFLVQALEKANYHVGSPPHVQAGLQALV